MLKGNILTTDGWIHGTVRFENGRVTALEGHIADPLANDAPYILPGFIDLHVLGAAGATSWKAAMQYRRAAARPARHHEPARHHHDRAAR